MSNLQKKLDKLSKEAREKGFDKPPAKSISKKKNQKPTGNNSQPNNNKSADHIFKTVKAFDGTVNGAKLAQEIESTLNKYLVLPDHSSEAITLWILFSYTFDKFDVCPILAITSPEKRCGKTSLLALLSALCQKVLAGSNITPAATFRAIDKWQPTLLVDEADTFLNQKDELKGILNSGHTRPTAFVTRAVPKGKGFTIQRFSTWTPKSIALIGKLPDTLEDRSIRVKMRRKKSDEQRQRIRYSKLYGQLKTLRSKIAKWASDFAPVEATPPAKLDDRAADNWLPLLTIANAIGWQNRATKTAISLSGTTDTQTYQTMLLEDISKIFDGKWDENDRKRDKIFTKVLLEKLNNDPEKPWREFSHGHPMNAHKLASMLRRFEISSQNIEINNERRKGYTKDGFKDTFERYL